MKRGGLAVLGVSAFPLESHAQQVMVLPILLTLFILREHRKRELVMEYVTPEQHTVARR